MNELISEFFVDIIIRVGPGVIVLALWADKLFSNLFLKLQHHDLTILSIPCFVGAAWVTGVVIEQATYLPGAFACAGLRRYLGKHNIKANACIEKLIGDGEGKSKSTANDADFKFRRRHQLKLAGETIFFRVMCAISVGTFFWPPTLLRGGQWPSMQFLCCNIPVNVLGALVFGFAWLWVKIAPNKICI